MQFGNKHRVVSKQESQLLQRLRSSRGQMTVELAVLIPVIMAVLGIVINAMMYMDVTIRFDRLAAEAVRIEAASPGYGAYGTAARTDRVRSFLQDQFANEEDFVQIDVSAHAGAGSTSDTSGLPSGDPSFSLLPRLETYKCTLHYSPWGFKGSFFGVNFLEMSHTRSYTIDPFRPGVFV